MFSRLDEVNKVKSSIPSCMKSASTLDVKTDGSLKVKRYTLVITSYETNSNSKVKIRDKEKASPHPITVREANDLKAKTRSIKVP